MDSLSGGSSDDGESVVPEMKGMARAAAAGDIVPLSKIAAQRGQMAAPLQVSKAPLACAIALLQQ